jgi:hypothetical protein
VRSDKGEITRWQRIFPKLSVLTVPATMWFGQHPYSPESGGHFFLMPEAGSRKERQMGNAG